MIVTTNLISSLIDYWTNPVFWTAHRSKLRGFTQKMTQHIKNMKPVAKATLISTIVAIMAGALVPSATSS